MAAFDNGLTGKSYGTNTHQFRYPGTQFNDQYSSVLGGTGGAIKTSSRGGEMVSALSGNYATNNGNGNNKVRTSMFANQYKEITFDTLKERHDNFSFDKVIETKHQVYDTLHIQGIQEKPNAPTLILFQKQGVPNQAKEYNNSKYQNLSHSSVFYDQFQRRVSRTRGETANDIYTANASSNYIGKDSGLLQNIKPPALFRGSHMRASEASRQQRWERHNYVQDSIDENQVVTGGDTTPQRRKLHQIGLGASTGQGYYQYPIPSANIRGDDEISQDNRKAEEEMWNDFSNHFKNKNRKQAASNHHDFLKSIKSQRGDTGSNSMKPLYSRGAAAISEEDAAERIFTVDRIERAKKNYQKLKLQSITIPAPHAKGERRAEVLANRGRERLKQREQQKHLDHIQWLAKMKAEQRPTSPLRKRAQKFEDDFKTRDFPERHLFVIIDDQDLFTKDALYFTYVEINDRLCRMVPQKVWDSKGAQRLDLYQKIEISKPSSLLQKQVLLETLDEINSRLKRQKETISYAYSIDGTPITSFMEIHQGCRVIVVSNSKHFKGLKGIDRFFEEVRKRYQQAQSVVSSRTSRPTQEIQSVKPKPATWVQTAAVRWLKQNDTADIPNYMECANSFTAADNDHQESMARDGMLMEALRDEHTRVHIQDLELLKNINVQGDNDTITFGSSHHKKSPGSRYSPSPQRTLDRLSMTAGAKDNSELDGVYGREVFTAGDTTPRQKMQEEPKVLIDDANKKDTISDFNPQFSKKPLSILQEDEPYIFAEIEEDMIKFLLEKVVIMREVPFMKASEVLERNNNLAKIHDQIKKIAPRHAFAAKMHTRRFQEAVQNRSTLRQTQPFDGNGSPELNEEDQYTSQNAGKVTFKVKQNSSREAGHDMSKNGSENQQDKEKLAQNGRMLQNEEIREICEKHALSRGEVYKIRSQFASMCAMSESLNNSFGDQAQNDLLSSKNSGYGKKGNDKGERARNLLTSSQADGINVDYFVKYCTFLSGSLPHITKRILIAQGLDVENQNVLVNWQTYLELYCIFEAGKIDRTHLIRFWLKFFDQTQSGQCPEDVYIRLLEELVRGNSLTKPNKTTKLFARMFQKQMEQANCLGEQNEIVNEKLAQAFEEERIDIQLLCSALGDRQSLDESFLAVEVE